MIRKLLLVGLVIGALTTPTALAKPVSSDVQNGGYDPWAYGLVYKSTHAQPASTNPLNGSYDPWAYGLVYQSVHPQPLNSAPVAPWERRIFQQSSATPNVTTSPSSGGFDFADAGIGAAASLGVAMTLLTAIGLGLKRRRSGLAIS
jgi:hypothetical protein